MATAPSAFKPLSEVSSSVAAWVAEVAALTTPDRIHWFDGSAAETARLRKELLATKELLPLNPESFPDCYLARSSPNDVARVEHLTFICTPQQEDAGPNNNWMAPDEAHAEMDALFKGCMKGRTLYVVPYCMGPIDSPYSRCGVEITDSAYVVLNMEIMTRSGRAALQRIEAEGGSFVKGLHSIGELDPNRRYIMHFPEELTIKSYGSGYGGNALLGKKCHALRIASYQARTEGWLAEHMLIVGLQNPEGQIHYIACAFPSACGKTNLAMLIPPASMPGWKVFTVGDDICWMHPGPDGRLWAINPESGYFGVAPGTSPKTNKNAFETVRKHTLFTNVALTANNEPWWEGMGKGDPVTDWQGRPYDPKNGPAAHPNSRFTVSARYNPSYTKEAENPKGVPISAIIFGGRRRETAPLIYQARSWAHGVLIGAGVASETTAAATGAVGVVRRDSMAMKPFCGYNFGDYFQHWLNIGAKLRNPPQIFHVNWFRQGADGKFLWPGFGDNLRPISWALQRVARKVDAQDTAIGYLPHVEDLDTNGLDIKADTLREILSVNADVWKKEVAGIRAYLGEYGSHMPQALYDELDGVAKRLN
jgi:phosphoenolpyruvate carboxykinase (GTP)